MTQAVTSIDPRLIGLLGRKLYSSNPIPIVVRELLQNAQDACIRKGVEPDITITIVQLEDCVKETWVVSCNDNGIGMTEDEIINDFLCLGGKKPNSENQTGGFGIAKASIMGCEDWKVWSLDNYLDRDILENSGTIKKRAMRNGTRVTVFVETSVYESTIRQALQMIYYSDVSVHVSVISKEYPLYALRDENAGFPADVKRKMLEQNERFDLWGSTKLGLSGEDLSSVNNTGWTTIRLNGLAQFVAGSNVPLRKNNLFFDIKTDADPEDATYPFSMSREELLDVYLIHVNSFRKAHDSNVIESAVSVTKDQPAEETVSVVTGKLLTGGRATSYTIRKDDENPGMGNKTITKLTIDEKIRKIKGSSEMAQLLITRYERESETRSWHAKILLVWQDVLQVAASDTEEFGIGITSERFSAAARQILNGTLYYVISPDTAVTEEVKEQSNEAIVLFLWTLACHEVTHKYVRDHNEWFTTTENNIMRDSSEVILRVLRKIAKRLL